MDLTYTLNWLSNNDSTIITSKSPFFMVNFIWRSYWHFHSNEPLDRPFSNNFTTWIPKFRISKLKFPPKSSDILVTSYVTHDQWLPFTCLPHLAERHISIWNYLLRQQILRILTFYDPCTYPENSIYSYIVPLIIWNRPICEWPSRPSLDHPIFPPNLILQFKGILYPWLHIQI